MSKKQTLQPAERQLKQVGPRGICYDLFSDQDLLGYLREPSFSKLNSEVHYPAHPRQPDDPASPSTPPDLSDAAAPSRPAFPHLSLLQHGYAACPTGMCYQPLIAANANNAEALTRLAALGADLNICDRHGYTPLMRAIKRRATDACHALLQLMPLSDIDLPGGIQGAGIRRIGESRQVSIPRQVLMSHSEPTVIANALHVAINEGNCHAVRLLCERGADVNQVSFIATRRNAQSSRFHCHAHALPVSWALYGARNRQSAAPITEYLIAHGASSAHILVEITENLAEFDDVSRRIAALVLAANPPHKCAIGKALCVAMDRARHGDFAHADRLVAMLLGASLPKGLETEMPLIVAYTLACRDTAVLAALLADAPDAPARVCAATSVAGVPLLEHVLRAAAGSRGAAPPSAVEAALALLLASRGAAEALRGPDGAALAALAAACSAGALRMLLDAGADIAAQAADGSTALLYSIATLDDPVAARHIVDAVDSSATLNVRDAGSRAALCEAAKDARFLGVVIAMLERGANVNVCDGAARTPLLHAVSRCLPDTVAVLLFRGASFPQALVERSLRAEFVWPSAAGDSAEERDEMMLALLQHVKRCDESEGEAGVAADGDADMSLEEPADSGRPRRRARLDSQLGVLPQIAELFVKRGAEITRAARTAPGSAPPHSPPPARGSGDMPRTFERAAKRRSRGSSESSDDVAPSPARRVRAASAASSPELPASFGGRGAIVEAAAAVLAEVAAGSPAPKVISALFRDALPARAAAAAAAAAAALRWKSESLKQRAYFRSMCTFISCTLKAASTGATGRPRLPFSEEQAKRSRSDQPDDRFSLDRESAEQPTLSRARGLRAGLHPELRELICARVFGLCVPTLRSQLMGSAPV